MVEQNAVVPGTLYVVATPIGNMSDLTPRAISVLKTVSAIYAEDTRCFGRLAIRHGIETPKRSYHDHNEQKRVAEIVAALEAGETIALVSDAGTPLVSDPGYRIVAACREANLAVSPIPGACAAIAALSVSGLPCHEFSFRGFVPQKPGKRGTLLDEIITSGQTTILYESPHRITKTCTALAEKSPEAAVCICRELTKLHEEILHGTAAEIAETLTARPSIKGEIVILISTAHLK